MGLTGSNLYKCAEQKDPGAPCLGDFDGSNLYKCAEQKRMDAMCALILDEAICTSVLSRRPLEYDSISLVAKQSVQVC